MPFGLINAPTIFMNLMNQTFQDCLDKFIVMLINNILVYYRIQNEHAQHLGFVFVRRQLYVKFPKCKFQLGRVVFLRHMVLEDGISADPSKIEVVLEW